MPRLGEIVCYKAGDNTEYAALVVRVYDDKVALNVFANDGSMSFMAVVLPGPAVGQYQTFETIEAAEAAAAAATSGGTI